MYPNQTKMSCKNSALSLLTRRDHGEYELYQKLILKGFIKEEIEEAMRYCREYGYLNDLRYAQGQVRWQITKGRGELRIRQDLQQKRIADEFINLALEEESIDWIELAKQTAEKKFKRAPITDYTMYVKCARYLQSRGFNYEQIQTTLNEQYVLSYE